tara:strand:- start:795 stop:1292 length:498 start_codon:yes stop_codon:yes gene_type:complete
MSIKTPSWDSGLCAIWVVLFFLPFTYHMIKHILKVMTKPLAYKGYIATAQVPEEYETSEHEFNATFTTSQPTPLSKEEQWKIIEDATMEKAMAGDKAARDWVTKHVFTDPVDPSTSQSDFTQDVVDALRPMGYKTADIKATIAELTRSKEYTSVDELIQDVIKSS